MAAGAILKQIKDAAGAIFNGKFWSSDGSGAGDTIPMHVIADPSTMLPANLNAVSQVNGSIASGSAAADPPVFIGARASTAAPTPVADGQVVALRTDKTGRAAVVPHQIRDLQDSAVVTVTASTTAATLIAAQGANVFTDLMSITLTNTDATTATEVQILDDDGATVRWEGYVPAKDMRGIVFPIPLKAAGANVTWKIKTVTSVSSIKATVQYVKNL